MSIYDTDLDKCPANYQPLTPLTFLQRSAQVYPERIAIIHGKRRVSYAEFYSRSRQLASALLKAGVKKGDTVAVLLANTQAMLECHYGVPMLGAVLNTLNTRLDAATIGFSLDHGEAKVFIVDKEFSKLGEGALELMTGPKPIVIDYVDPEFAVEGIALATSSMSRSCRAAMPLSSGCGRETNGKRSRSTIPQARPAIPRAWSIIIAALRSSRKAMC